MQEDVIIKSTLCTLVYFDVANMPLTLFEVWRYMIDAEKISGKERTKEYPVSLSAVSDALDTLKKKRIVEEKNGLYFLRGRAALGDQRMRRIKVSVQKLRRARRWIRLLEFVPFVRSAAITGRLALKMGDRGSDWDVLIVMKHGRIFTGRALVTALFHILGKRRHGTHTRDHICLNYFITDTSLEIQRGDLFAAREYAFAFPVIGAEMFAQFERENIWIQSYLPHWMPAGAPSRFAYRPRRAAAAMRNFFEKIIGSDFLEALLRRIQKNKIQNNPKTHKQGSYIYAEDDALIFLPSPQSPRVFKRFMKRLSSLYEERESFEK